VTPADIQAVAAEVSASALLMVPEGHNATWAGFVPAPTDSTARVSGTSYPMRNQRHADLVVGADGVSVVSEDSFATVRFDECAAMLVWPDGGRMLIGNDSLVCRVEPTLYDIPEAALRQIDAAVPADRQLPQPAREADAIPRPPDPVSVPAPRRKVSGLRIAGLSVLGLFSLIMVCFSGLATLGLAGSEEEIEGGWVVVGGFWFVTLLVVVPTIWLIRLTRRSRTSA